MPIPTETFRNIRKLNVVFALSALFGMAATLWMLFADFNRPWRGVQTEYFNVQAALAHFEWLGFQSPEKKAERDRLRRDVAKAEENLTARRDDRESLEAEQRRIAGELQAAGMAYGNAKAQIQVSEFNYEEALALHGPEHHDTQKRLAALEAERKRLAELQAAKEKLDDADRAQKLKIKRFFAERDDAKKKLAAFDKSLDDAKQRDEFYGSKGSALLGIAPVRSLFNVPGLDFLAPKNTPGRQEIRQVVLHDVRSELNFGQSYTTDRCITCHIGIDNPALTRENFRKTLETALRTINEQRSGENKPALVFTPPDFKDAGGAERKGEPFESLSSVEKDAYVAALGKTVNEYLVSTGRSPVEYGQPLLAHPDLELFVSPDSPHPMSRMGCTVCHEGNPQETDFVLASHSPRDEKQEHEWAEKYYVRQAGIPETTLHVAHEFWERPMLLSKNTSASCVKCHTQPADLKTRVGEPLPAAEPIVKGAELYTTLGCINCHAVEGLNDSRRVGPDLTHVGDKLSADFMHRWIEYPKNYRPSTLMPHPFRQENNLPSSRNEFDPDPILRTETEIQAITHYLLTFSKPYEKHSLPSAVKGDVKRGEELFTAIGCLACHANLAAVDPNDEEGRTFGERWIVAELRHQGVESAEAKKRYTDMTHNQRVEFAMRSFPDHRREELQRVADAERRAAEAAGRDPDLKKLYVPPAFTRFAPELGTLGSKLILNPDDADQAGRARAWLYDWLRDPRHYSGYTKMPRMFRDGYYWKEQDPAAQRTKNDQDILDVTDYLLSLRHDEFKPQAFPRDGRHLGEAKRLVRMLLGGQNTESMVEAILADEPLDRAAPRGPLSERIVKGVARSFGEGAAGEEAASRIFADQSLDDRLMLFLGSKMITHYGCYACHQIAGFENATRPGTEMTAWGRKLLSQLDFAFYYDGFKPDRDAQPDVFGHLFPKSAEFERLVADTGENPHIHISHTHAGFAYHKLRNPRLWDRAKIKRPYDKLKMPNFFLSPRETESLVTFLLSRQAPQVTRSVQVNYADTPAGRAARGRQVATELNCIGCHSIENNFANVHQYFIKPDPASGELVFDVTNAPPNLFGQGGKTQFTWLFGFLNNVEMLRPWLKIRMPSFHLDAEQTRGLIEYFVGATQLSAEALQERIAKAHGFIDTAKRAAPAAADGPPPGADWWREPSLASAADWLGRFALRNRLITPYDIEPAAGTPAEEAIETRRAGFTKVLDRTGFLQPAFDVKYPFAAAPRPPMNDAEYTRGKALLLELKCLACHVAGDPFAKDTTLDIKAPNFALAQRRLQHDWIVKWLLNPQLFQPGTNMPQLFVGGNSAFKDFPEADRATAEAKFGKTGAEQIRLLVDTLYEIGRRNETVTQPPDPNAAKPPPADAPEAPAGEMGSEFDEEPAKPAEKKPEKDDKKEPEKPAEKAGDDFEP